jgi:phage/conjugal plasmid C-4 type zinc finger TraR family protein
MDAAEVAQEYQADHNKASLEAQQRVAGLDAPGSDVCADCGEAIPAARCRALPSAIRCVECQAWAERIART